MRRFSLGSVRLTTVATAAAAAAGTIFRAILVRYYHVVFVRVDFCLIIVGIRIGRVGICVVCVRNVGGLFFRLRVDGVANRIEKLSERVEAFEKRRRVGRFVYLWRRRRCN